MSLTVTDILSFIRDNSDDMYIERVDPYNGENLGQIGDYITSDKNVMNDFMNKLINKIAMTNIVSKMYNNPLAKLKSSNVPMGSTIEEIFVNPATDVGFQKDGSRLLLTTTPDGKSAYYGLNRKSTYPSTISKNELKQAFTSENAFMSLYNKIITTLYSGDQIDEFILTKRVVAKTIDDGHVNVIDSDITNPKALAKAISNMSKAFTFPSTEFAPYNLVNKGKFTDNDKECITFCPLENQVLLLRADVETEINFEILANMFNMQLAEIKAMTILVDSFPANNYDIYAVLCDKDAIQIRDNTFETDNLYNGSNMRYNIWLHHWEFIFCSTFGNMVAFGKTKSKDATSVTVTGSATITTDNGTTQLTATVAPDVLNDNVTWTSSNNAVATVDSNGKVTALTNGTVTITATSVQTPTVSGTKSITISNQV
jgi:uncharacterized protein YjdB